MSSRNPTRPQPPRKKQSKPQRRHHAEEKPMFFERLRSRRAQVTIYLGLAIVFAASFVIGGVGSGGGLSLGDLFNNGSSGGSNPNNASLKTLQRRVAQHPKDAAAWQQLGLAQQSSDPNAAIRDFKKAVALAPNDANARQQLAALYQTQGATLQSQVQQMQSGAVQLLQAGPQASPFSRPFTGRLAGIGTDELTQAQQAQLNVQAQQLQTQASKLQPRATSYLNNAVAQWAALTRQQPSNPGFWLQYGEAANSLNDKATTTRALKKFLALAPDDPQAPQVKAFLKQLNPPPTTSTASTGTATGG